MNKTDLVDDEELIELVEMELGDYWNLTILMIHLLYKVLLLGALNGEQSGVDSVMELMETVDSWIETPEERTLKLFNVC